MKIFNKKNLLLSSAIVAGMLFTVGTKTVQADTTNSSEGRKPSVVVTRSSKKELTDSEIRMLDKFVQVRNNQYVLNTPANFKISDQMKKVVEDVIAKSNQDVRESDSVINPSTKTIDEQTVPTNADSIYTVLARSSKNKNYTWKKFGWGTRYYFRSNAAVYQMDHELDSYSLACGVAGTIGALASAGWAEAVGGLSAAYFQKIKSDLDYMNNTHPHNYLYMDVNHTGLYTIKVLR